MSRCALVFASMLVAVPVPAQSLAARIDRRIDASGLSRNFWGIAISELDGTPIYGRNAEKLFIPASNAKLALVATALALVDPRMTVATSVYAAGPVVNGTVQGDLVLYGRGDPTFSRRCYHTDSLAPGACEADPATRLKALASLLQARGIRRITGNLIADGSWFESQRVHPTWEGYDLGWYYAAPVSGLGFNDNAIDVRTIAGPRAGAPVTSIVSYGEGLTLITRGTTGAAGSRRTFDIFRSADGLSFNSTGSVPLGTAMTEYPAVADPDRAAGWQLRMALQSLGISTAGTVRSTSDSMLTAAARKTAPLAEVRSRPFSDWLFPVLNTSQNLFAETILKQIGRLRAGSGSWSAGLTVERRYLIDSLRVDSTAFSLADGSGLSGNNLITPTALTILLRRLWTSPLRDVVLRGLPRSGQPGTLVRRFIGTPLEGQVVAKSGAKTGVNALSGFVELPGGRIVVFSVITNNHTLGSARMIAAIDSVVVEIGKVER